MLNLEESRPPSWTGHAIVALTLLAPAMAGSTEQWAMAAMAALVGAFFLIAPPRRALPLVPTIGFVALLLLAAGGFLPAVWSSFPNWRLDLMKLGAELPPTRSPQPWLTLQWWLYLFLILCWAYYVCVYPWSRSSRERALVTFAIGILVLASAVIICHATARAVPFWPNVPEYGFFPNRNQTGNVLGLAGIVIYAIGLQRLQEHRPTWWLWLCSLSIICWALILNYSRAGIVIFFGGTFLWHVCWVFQAREKRGPIVALVCLGLLFGVLLLNGGKTLARLETSPLAAGGEVPGGRVPIFQDALGLIHETPLLGAGMGNFRSLFSSARHNFWSTSEAVHPESDWLWGAADVGWLGPAIVLVLILWWIVHCLPFAAGSARAFRIASLICGVAFALHGLIDVSAHRLGTLFPALFLAGVSLHPNLPLVSSRGIQLLFRLAGFCLLIVSGSWFTAVVGDSRLPSVAEVARLEGEMARASTDGDYEAVLSLTNRGLDAAPINWPFYYHRGVAEAALFLPRTDIFRDFAIAQYLFPQWPDVYLKEGMVWLQLGEPDLAFTIWKNGMSRLGANAAELFYASIYPEIKDNAEMRERWRTLATGDPGAEITFLRNASPAEFQIELSELLTTDPDLRALPERELADLFLLWYEKGDRLAFIESLQSHPAWQKVAWRQLARAYGDYADYRRAYETAVTFMAPPPLPDVAPSDYDALARRFEDSPAASHDALPLAVAEWRKGLKDDALKTIAIGLDGSRPPPTLLYLEARLWGEKGDWQKAWQAMGKYLDQL